MIKKKSFDVRDLASLLGSITAPGSLSDFSDGLCTKHGNIIRRRHDFHPDDIPFQWEPIPWYSLGSRCVNSPVGPTRTLAYASGAYFVQDAGSLLALALAEADKPSGDPLLICDLCAAPGAKASALLELAEQNGGFLLANEVIGSRIAALSSNLSRTGSDRFAISSLDASELADKLGSIFDLVLVDAPCSGQAMLSRGKQSLASFSKQQIEHSALRQHRILDAATRLIKPSGKLVYSTCTFAEDENESQVKRLIDSGSVENISDPTLAQYQTDRGCYRLWPHIHQCAGSFGAAMRYIGNHHTSRHRWKPSQKQRINVPLDDWYIDRSSTARLHQINASLIAWPQDAPQWVEEISCTGPEIAYRTGQTWKPSHAGALRDSDKFQTRNRLEIDAEQANKYLQGETISVDKNGWTAVFYNKRPLGWTKVSGGKGKNHLPTHARFNSALMH